MKQENPSGLVPSLKTCHVLQSAHFLPSLEWLCFSWSWHGFFVATRKIPIRINFAEKLNPRGSKPSCASWCTKKLCRKGLCSLLQPLPSLAAHWGFGIPGDWDQGAGGMSLLLFGLSLWCSGSCHACKIQEKPTCIPPGTWPLMAMSDLLFQEQRLSLKTQRGG